MVVCLRVCIRCLTVCIRCLTNSIHVSYNLHYRCLTGSACGVARVHIRLIVCTCGVHMHAAQNSLIRLHNFEIIRSFLDTL